jgi:hypothetical protein
VLKICLLALITLFVTTGGAKASDTSIPQHDIDLIMTADLVEVSGTNDLGGAENFGIHDRKAIKQFTDLLTADRYIAAPKSLQPKFKSASSYKIRFSSQGVTVLELTIIGDSILDIPGDPMFYVEADSYTENLMAPLLRLR